MIFRTTLQFAKCGWNLDILQIKWISFLHILLFLWTWWIQCQIDCVLGSLCGSTVTIIQSSNWWALPSFSPPFCLLPECAGTPRILCFCPFPAPFSIVHLSVHFGLTCLWVWSVGSCTQQNGAAGRLCFPVSFFFFQPVCRRFCLVFASPPRTSMTVVPTKRPLSGAKSAQNRSFSSATVSGLFGVCMCISYVCVSVYVWEEKQEKENSLAPWLFHCGGSVASWRWFGVEVCACWLVFKYFVFCVISLSLLPILLLFW